MIGKFDSYKKSMYRESKTKNINEQNFITLLNDRFNIAPKIKLNSKKVFDVVEKLDDSGSKGCDKENFKTFEMTNDQVDTEFETTNSNSDTDVNYPDEENDADFETTQKSKFSSKTATEVPKDSGVIHKIIN